MRTPRPGRHVARRPVGEHHELDRSLGTAEHEPDLETVLTSTGTVAMVVARLELHLARELRHRARLGVKMDRSEMFQPSGTPLGRGTRRTASRRSASQNNLASLVRQPGCSHAWYSKQSSASMITNGSAMPGSSSNS